MFTPLLAVSVSIYLNLNQLCDFLKFFLTLCFFPCFPPGPEVVLEIVLFSSVHFSSTQTFIEGLFRSSMAGLVVLNRGRMVDFVPLGTFGNMQSYFLLS